LEMNSAKEYSPGLRLISYILNWSFSLMYMTFSVTDNLAL
jgi:hypothetical protein